MSWFDNLNFETILRETGLDGLVEEASNLFEDTAHRLEFLTLDPISKLEEEHEKKRTTSNNMDDNDILGAIQLTDDQIEEFHKIGYLFLPNVFTTDEVRVLNDELCGLFSRSEPYNINEQSNSKIPRTNFAAHLVSKPFAKLSRHPRIIRLVETLLNDKLYVHQFKINKKTAFEGEVWQWHQDYSTWLHEDMMPTNRAMNVAVFLDDVNHYNGPLMFVPGSHKAGVISADYDTTTTSYPIWKVNNDLISELVDRAGGKQGGIVSPIGPAGSVVLFHSCLVHSSSTNISPWHRNIVYLSLCATSNCIRRFKRPEYIAHRSFDPIICLLDDCLLDSTIDEQISVPWSIKLPDSALNTMTDIICEDDIQEAKDCIVEGGGNVMELSLSSDPVVVFVETPSNQLSLDEQYIVVDETENISSLRKL